MKERIIYYSNTETDDFAGNNIQTDTVDDTFSYVRTGFLWRAASFFLYYIIALPLLWIFDKIYFALTIENKKVLRSIKSGYFLYGNHTHFADAYLGPQVSFPKKTYIIANADAVSIPGLKHVVMMLGCLPIPTNRKAMSHFLPAVEKRAQDGACITVFPEAHIWPYYTRIRPFSDVSFRYPAKLNLPAVGMVTTYHKRKGIFGWLGFPKARVHISEPFYPDPSLPLRQRQQKLHDEVYNFMVQTAEQANSYEYITYRKKETTEK